jgi:hypothetical protein
MRTHLRWIILILLLNAAFAEQKTVHSELHPALQPLLKSSCVIIERCQQFLQIDCQSELDGPEYFVDNQDGVLLMRCGGRCLIKDPNDPLDCRACPPPAWQHCRAQFPMP